MARKGGGEWYQLTGLIFLYISADLLNKLSLPFEQSDLKVGRNENIVYGTREARELSQYYA
jgi:hypothetical protein